MSSISKVVVVQHDRRAVDAVRLGFEREGATVVAPSPPGGGDGEAASLLGALDADVALLVAGADDAAAARALLRTLTAAAERCPAAPILYVGNGIGRAEAWAAGADEVLLEPAFVRDVVVVGRLLAGRKKGHRATVTGDLAECYGVFYLVRALAATGRSGVLTLVRGLRRGEVRFFEGEVTSAQMGALHGQAALHQLLLWVEARFEWRHEPVVRRRQIPLPHVEVLEHAERFLHDVRDVAGGLSPAAVYEPDVAKIQAMGRQLPTEVHGVLRLFDGNRTLADVLEDSPFRVFETLRVAHRAVETGLLRKVVVQRPKAALRAMLAVDEWLVGDEPRDAVIDRTMGMGDSEPVAASAGAGGGAATGKGGKKKKKGGRNKKPARDPGPSRTPAAPAAVDWASLVPRAGTVEPSGITGVVPSSEASGEIQIGVGALAARAEGREGLESLTDAEARTMMFPGSEPSVTVDLGPEPQGEAQGEAEREADPVTEPISLAEPESVVVAPEASEPVTVPVTVPVPARAVAEAGAAAAASFDAALADARAPLGTSGEGAEAETGTGTKAEAETATKAEAETETETKAEAEAEAEAETETATETQAPGRVRRASGEIAAVAEPAPAPSPVVDAPAVVVEPSVLVADLAAASAAVTAVAAAQAAKPATVDTHDPARSAEIKQVREHAVAFTEDEEAFFHAGHAEAKTAPRIESFDDLDDDYEPQTFWERLRGVRASKKRRK